MGGKRPDQYAIDPGEANATDYKSRRQEDFTEVNKDKVERSMADSRQGDNLIPQGGVNPALAELRARKARDEAQARGDHAREGGLHGGGHAAASRHPDRSDEGSDQSADAARVEPDERASDAERTE